ncbi:lysosomal amino acid transporter 1 homolog [Alosa alosa]|nr:lysosomal amino acid transporter 1 homolog [Alosa sapidissima]XP_041953050.1 lysosomal amino acid transporter 1 homolog [Alosa sapidissima]XP_041953051.1 lysosomal amino acid transporter 1 homolog [Alosa sapidissima]XP_041953052.1 lysosomal amino acid transporter 1 homolog [Alosa sapidissima]XP_041953053.1 lysosomal amino acid transporter 1 homolog [Alosa sapidissima]XP_048096659.1 lysosomal amino acid transporter 1 homolog [Alosa alosa]XP_048096660.1 lysosomal amino acid transporter 1 hom
MVSDGILSRISVGAVNDGNFSSLCPNGSVWVWEGLGECSQDARDMASVILGLLSIVCFMISSLPQYYSSCRTGNMDQALSIWFLLLWLSGDTCNLVGSFLADQLPLQTYTAVYYVLADILMLGLYMYYKTKNRLSANNGTLNAFGVLCLLGMSSLVALPGSTLDKQVAPVAHGSRTLLSVSEEIPTLELTSFTTREIIGFTIGSVSSVMYLCSRLPQIYTNYKRKSTEGVSFFLFALVILGNTTYGLSVLMKNPENGQGEVSYVIHHLPWLIGSLGTLCLDVFISLQFMTYNGKHRDSVSSDENAPLLGN